MPRRVRSEQTSLEIPRRLGTWVNIGGVKARLYRLNDIAEFWRRITYK